jgi:hypothetical protein
MVRCKSGISGERVLNKVLISIVPIRSPRIPWNSPGTAEGAPLELAPGFGGLHRNSGC